MKPRIDSLGRPSASLASRSSLAAGSLVKFGTDGWRGVIGDDFTFERVRLVAACLAEVLEQGGAGGKAIVVGYDRRFLSAEFARAVTEVMAGAGFTVHLGSTYAPTPAVSLAVKARGAAAGIVITASHNPPRWNGFKVKESFGGSARTDTTGALERAIQKRIESPKPLPRMTIEEAEREGRVIRSALAQNYLSALESLVDLGAIARAGFRIVVDPIHGAGSGMLARLLAGAGVDVTEIRAEENPCFGGVNPEPIDENLGALKSFLERMRANGGAPAFGIALDGDADRVGAIDEEGAFFDSHRIFATLLRHLHDSRGLTGKVVQTVSSTVMVRRLAARRSLAVVETPIGFKYIADHMLEGDVLMGGEESGGLGFQFHLPERDAALSALLLLEACAKSGQPPRALLGEVFDEVGAWEYRREDVHLDPAKSAEIVDRVRGAAPDSIAGLRVHSRNDRDGVKFVLDGDCWLLLRPSGTEPVLRLYAEAPTAAGVRTLLAEGRKLAGLSASAPSTSAAS